MIKVTNQLPAFLTGDLNSLEKEWQRFADGIVTFNELNDALKAQFSCSAVTEVEDLSEDEANEENFSPLAKLIPTGPGKLFFLAKNMIWAQENGTCWCVDYRDIILHASRAESLDLHIQMSTVWEGDQEIVFNGGEDEFFPFLAVSFSFSDPESVDDAFVALSECAALHPDSESESDDDDLEDEMSSEQDHNDVDDSVSVTDSKKTKIEQYDDEARDLLR